MGGDLAERLAERRELDGAVLAPMAAVEADDGGAVGDAGPAGRAGGPVLSGSRKDGMRSPTFGAVLPASPERMRATRSS